MLGHDQRENGFFFWNWYSLFSEDYQDPHVIVQNALNNGEVQVMGEHLNHVQRDMVMEPVYQQQPAMYRQLPLVPQVCPQEVQDEYDEEENYVPPVDDLHIPRALDYNRIGTRGIIDWGVHI